MLPVSRFQHFLCPGSDNEWTSNNTLYNVCAVPWGVLSTMGVFSTVGDIMSTVGGYLEYRGGCSVPWGDIMINVGDILSTGGIS